CQEARQMLWIADITTESRPFGVASFTVPEASGDFCTRGGRFGTHSSNESFTPIYYRRILFIAHFNAGVRAVDIRDPYHPPEPARGRDWYGLGCRPHSCLRSHRPAALARDRGC